MTERRRTYAQFLVAVLVLSAAALIGIPMRALIAQQNSLAKIVDAQVLLNTASAPDGVRVIVTLTGASTSAAAPPPASATSAGATGAQNVQSIATSEQSAVLGRHVGANAAKAGRWAIRVIPNSPYMAMTVNQSELTALAADPDVTRIHEDGQVRPSLQDSVPLIGMPAVHALGGTGGNNTMVVIMDTGVEYGHVFTTPRVTNSACFSTTNASFTTLCPNGQASQFGGDAGVNCTGSPGCDHGTHVAGIAAGNRATGVPLNGVAKEANIFAYQVFSRRNSDSALTAFDSDILAALNDLLGRVDAELAGTKVASINLSLGDSGALFTNDCDATARAIPFKSVLDSLKTKNVATAIAAGNDFQTNQTSFPGCISTAIVVSNTTKTDVVSTSSNLSPNTDLFAPGTSITSSINPTPNFDVKTGTSMSTPHITGVFAALRSIPGCSSKTVDQIETALKNTGLPVTDTRSGGFITKPRVRADLALQELGCAAKVAQDFNGDGKSDILWRNVGSGAEIMWLMNGTQVIGSGSIGGDATWTVVATGDFNGDGKVDLLWRNSATGNVIMWLMNGTQVIGSAFIGGDANWSIAQTGDFNGDTKSDILWRHSSGVVIMWLMNGTQVTSSAAIGGDANWTVVKTGDFNGDSKSDILWRHSSGLVVMWLMNGTQVTGSAGIGGDASWTVVETGDFNGDTKADILWRHSSGVVIMWLMNGTQVTSSAAIGGDSNWSVARAGDFNGDTKSDILWRQASTGVVIMWLMNGTQVTSSAAIGGDTGWSIIP
jgi:hypothetical protein